MVTAKCCRQPVRATSLTFVHHCSVFKEPLLGTAAPGPRHWAVGKGQTEPTLVPETLIVPGLLARSFRGVRVNPPQMRRRKTLHSVRGSPDSRRFRGTGQVGAKILSSFRRPVPGSRSTDEGTVPCRPAPTGIGTRSFVDSLGRSRSSVAVRPSDKWLRTAGGHL